MAEEGGKKGMRVALVEFLNAVPLYYALKENLVENDFEFISDVPSRCARLLYENRVDISNTSIVEYVNSDNYRLLRDGCISTLKKVKSVVLFVHKPINKVKVVKLDRNSKTSNALAMVIFKLKYGITADYVFEGEADCELVIGDRALKRLKQGGEPLDLALEWYEFTGLPFVFAAWITNKPLDEYVVGKFLKAKEMGKKLIKEICSGYKSIIPEGECQTYLTENISYDFDAVKKESINVFFRYAYKIGAIPRKRELLFI